MHSSETPAGLPIEADDSGPDMSLVAGDCGSCGDDRGGAVHQERCVAKGDMASVNEYFRALKALEGR
jgi:hypothetical protein